MGRDEDADQAVRDLLQKYETEEAAVLRAELIAFLKSAETRAELEAIIRKPLEAVVLSALTKPAFQEQLRDAVIASLKPELVKAAESAAASALSQIKVAIPADAQQRMRAEAEETLRNAFVNAQKDALGTVPRLANEGRRQLPAADGPTAPRLPREDSMNWVAVAVIGVVAAIALVWFFFLRGDNRAATTTLTDDSSAVSTQTGSDTAAATVTNEARTSRLFEQYQLSLVQAPANLPDPTAAQFECVQNGIARAEETSRLDVGLLRMTLNTCGPLGTRPSGASRIIAGVQAQLTEEARAKTCSALPPVAIDGKHGGETSKALKTYVGCTAPLGVPEALETLGDYAAVGVYFIDKRMRDAR